MNYTGFIKIIEALIFSPLLAFVVGFLLYSVFKVVFKNSNLAKTNRNFRLIQIATAALQSFTHGTNDAQKAMGIITMALIVNNYQSSADIQLWVQASCFLPWDLEPPLARWKIIKTVGGKK